MKEALKKYTVQLAYISVALLLLAIVLLNLLGFGVPTVVYAFPVYFIILNFLVHRSLLKANSRSPIKFVNAFMAALGIKMMVSLVVFVICGLFYKSDLAVIAIVFLFMYFTYTAFEIKYLLAEIREDK